MTAYQPPRAVPFHAVIGGLPSGVFIRHMNWDQVAATRRTWEMQGLHSYVRALDDGIDQLKASHASFRDRTNAGMEPDPVQAPRFEQTEKVTDPIPTGQAAALLNCSAEWVRSLIREGHLIAERRGKAWDISHASVLAYRDAKAGEVQAEAA